MLELVLLGVSSLLPHQVNLTPQMPNGQYAVNIPRVVLIRSLILPACPLPQLPISADTSSILLKVAVTLHSSLTRAKHIICGQIAWLLSLTTVKTACSGGVSQSEHRHRSQAYGQFRVQR